MVFCALKSFDSYSLLVSIFDDFANKLKSSLRSELSSTSKIASSSSNIYWLILHLSSWSFLDFLGFNKRLFLFLTNLVLLHRPITSSRLVVAVHVACLTFFSSSAYSFWPGLLNYSFRLAKLLGLFIERPFSWWRLLDIYCFGSVP